MNRLKKDKLAQSQRETEDQKDKEKNDGKMVAALDNGCDSVGRVVASDTRSPRFECTLRWNFTMNIPNLLLKRT